MELYAYFIGALTPINLVYALIGVTVGISHAANNAAFTRPSIAADLALSMIGWGSLYGSSIDTACIRNTAVKTYSRLKSNCPANRRVNRMWRMSSFV